MQTFKSVAFHFLVLVPADERCSPKAELYAEYEPGKLLGFLRSSSHYNLEKIFQICKKKDYIDEMVFLLGRMGNNKQALTLLIERVGDVNKVSKASCVDRSR